MALKMEHDRQGPERRGRRARPPHRARPDRRHRLLHGRGTRAGVGHPASRRGEGGGPGLRAHPVAGRAARLLEADAAVWATRRRRRLLHARGARELETQLRISVIEVEFHFYPAPATPSSTRTVRRCTTRSRPTCSGTAPWPSSASTWATRHGGRGEAGLVDRYLTLGLRLGSHIDGLVDAYYGPPARAQAADRSRCNPPARLVAEARALVADIDAGARWMGPPRSWAVSCRMTGRPRLDVGGCGPR